MEYVIGIIVAVLGFLGLNFFKNKGSLEEDILEERREELIDKIDQIEEKERELEENGPGDLKADEVVDYWKNND